MRKYLKFILLFLFAVLIFWVLGRNVDWQEVSLSLRKANATYLIMATLIVCLGYLLRAIRWGVLLDPITQTTLKELFAATTVGFSVIFVIGRAGEIIRPMWLSMRDHRVRPSASLVTLGLERIFDLAALVCFFSINLIWFKVPTGRETEVAYIKFIGNLLLVGTAVGFAALFVYQKYSNQIIEWTEKKIDKKFIPRRIRAVIVSLLKQLSASLLVLENWREIAAVVFWTILLWLTIALPTWLVLLAFNLPLSFVDAMFLMGPAALGSVVPTPGGAAGAFHAATAGTLIFLNIPQNDAVATAFAMHLVYFAPAVIFGLYYFFHGDITIARLRSLLSSEHAVEEVEHEKEFKVQSSRFKVKS